MSDQERPFEFVVRRRIVPRGMPCSVGFATYDEAVEYVARALAAPDAVHYELCTVVPLKAERQEAFFTAVKVRRMQHQQADERNYERRRLQDRLVALHHKVETLREAEKAVADHDPYSPAARTLTKLRTETETALEEAEARRAELGPGEE